MSHIHSLALICINQNEIVSHNQAALVLFSQKNKLTGPLPDSIGKWVNLETFSVRDNELTGVIPATIENWVNVEIARFENNSLTGSLEGICNNAMALQNVSADCLLEVECSCCDRCL